jgi:hypothetical protein
MALGGGIFYSQNRVLPGTYINFVSAIRATDTLSERGRAAMALELDWGVDESVFTVDVENLKRDCLKLFGYDYSHEKLKGLRDLFRNIRTGYFYRLNSGNKAANAYAEAKNSGVRGNDIKIIIATNVDDPEKFDVITMLGTTKVDSQTVAGASTLIDNDFVKFKKDATLAATVGTALTGGTNGTVGGSSYQDFLDKIEAYSFHALGCTSTEDTVKALFVQFTKRMRDEMGVKFQTVLHNKAADYEGVVNVKNSVTDVGENAASLVYWVTGIIAGCAVNQSNTNKLYDGEFTVGVEYKQTALETALKAGELVLHKVGDTVRVLDDINSLVSFTDEKNNDFSSNQTIRVLDQIANDIAVLFNTRYLGKIQNNESGRVSFWNDIVTYNRQLESLQAIQNFIAEDVVVEQGSDKKSVVVSNAIQVVNAMTKLYMTVVVE